MQYVIKYTIWINISKENAKFHDKWCVLDQKANKKNKNKQTQKSLTEAGIEPGPLIRQSGA